MKLFQLFSLIMMPAPKEAGHKSSRGIGFKRLLQCCLLVILALSLAGCGGKTVVAESAETIDNWTIARRFQAEGRYELARQHYTLALATVRTQSSLDVLKREITSVDMQLRAMR